VRPSSQRPLRETRNPPRDLLESRALRGAGAPRLANGKLVEKWAEKDTIALLQQIGVMPRAPQ